MLGLRLRGKALGIALAYAWVAYPYTLFALETNTNDTLVAALLVWALVALSTPVVRGALIGLASAAKFAALGLVPLFAAAGRPVRFVAAFAVVVAATVLPFLPDGGLRDFYDTTLGFHAGRESPFSVWGQEPGLDWLHTAREGRRRRPRAWRSRSCRAGPVTRSRWRLSARRCSSRSSS